MLYHELHAYLKGKVGFTPEEIPLPELGQRIVNFEFTSDCREILENSNKVINEAIPQQDGAIGQERDLLEVTSTMAITRIPDEDIAENNRFKFHVLHDGEAKADKAIVLLHGFNERTWDKYLPWASFLAASTGAAVIMFPIAFHMNRSPALWSDQHQMRQASQLRKKLFPNITGSSLSNVAISVRMQLNPERFFWSGMQSFRDVCALARGIREGRSPYVSRDASIDFFTYSIGTFLGEVVMFADTEGLFADSKLCAFCGGPVFNRLSPVSKFIIDSEGAISLHSFLVERLEGHIKADPKLGRFLIAGTGEAGRGFRSLIDYNVDRERREEKFRSMADRIYAIAMKQDQVEPYYEVLNTLKGADRNIPIKVDVDDFLYPCRHEDPFPVNPKLGDQVDLAFTSVFRRFSDFLR
jgi:hypothetical protein